MKILITGGKSAVALKLLKAFENEEVILADYGEVPSFPSSSYKFISLSEKNEDITAHVLLNHCLDYGVDYLLPLYEFEIEPVDKAKILFQEFNVNLLLPGVEDLKTYSSLPITKTAWAILINGAVVYSTLETAQLGMLFATNVSGAFYVEEVNGILCASLIRI